MLSTTVCGLHSQNSLEIVILLVCNVTEAILDRIQLQ